MCWASLVAQLVKNLPTMQETPVQFLGWEYPSVGEGIGHPLQCSWVSLVVQLVKNLPAMWENWVRSLGWKISWRRERLPTPVFWPGEFHGLYSPWGCKESDMTEWLSLTYVCAIDSQSNNLIPNISWTLYLIVYVGWVNLIDMVSRAPCDLAQGSLYFSQWPVV